jgi:serine/threonine protein kinase, bacterial
VPASIEETGKMVSQWQQDWSKAEALFKDIDDAVAKGNWDKVMSYRDNPEKLPNIQYWRDKIDPMFKQAADNLAKQQIPQVSKSPETSKKANPKTSEKSEAKQDSNQDFFNLEKLFNLGVGSGE